MLTAKAVSFISLKLITIELMIGERFVKYKQNLIGLKDAVEKHFSRTIIQIEAGLPDIQDEADFCRDLFSLKHTDDKTWTCPTCTNINQITTAECGICRTKMPVVKIE